jgi:hypothetical protein
VDIRVSASDFIVTLIFVMQCNELFSEASCIIKHCVCIQCNCGRTSVAFNGNLIRLRKTIGTVN